ncbi:hypothetical protein [Priestia megaterium]
MEHSIISNENNAVYSAYIDFFGGLAQLREHLPYKQGGGGSIPS